MNWFKQLFSRRRLFNELSEEIQAHLEEKIEELVASGMPRKEAAAAARREFGNVTLMEEDSRAVWQLPTVDSFFADIRYAVRSLRKDRRFALIAIFALALGIGASTVIFSIIYNGLLNPFPYKDANGISIFQIHDLDQAGVGGRGAFSVQEFLDYREQNHVFEDMVGTSYLRVLYTYREGAMQLTAAKVTSNTFEFLGVMPFLGRWITTEDARAGAPPVFLMNYKFWKEQFNGDPNVIGATIILNNQPTTLVGIMPPPVSILRRRHLVTPHPEPHVRRQQ